jgi:hypothetical protein
LCDSSNEVGTPPNSFCPSKSFLHTSHSTSVYVDSPYPIKDIPFVGRPSVLDYLMAMSFALHASSELRDLKYDKFFIDNIHCISTTFNGDVLFKLPLIVSLNGHYG